MPQSIFGQIEKLLLHGKAYKSEEAAKAQGIARERSPNIMERSMM